MEDGCDASDRINRNESVLVTLVLSVVVPISYSFPDSFDLVAGIVMQCCGQAVSFEFFLLCDV